MKHVIIPDAPGCVRRLPFYLAAEEWVARNLPRGEYFFTWVVDSTVIFGRNQLIDAEVDLEYCRAHGIQTYRRRSGGGCVFADRDNIMISYITWRTDIGPTFARYTEIVARMLRKLGLDASSSGRNDVLIGNRKVSGNAFYHLPGRSIAHGTMLYSTNVEHMLHAITPSRSKLESKQVQSVASHITTIKEHLPELSFDHFRAHIINEICDEEPVTLTSEQIAEIEQTEQEYYRHEWIFGRKGPTAHRRRRRVHGRCGLRQRRPHTAGEPWRRLFSALRPRLRTARPPARRFSYPPGPEGSSGRHRCRKGDTRTHKRATD